MDYKMFRFCMQQNKNTRYNLSECGEKARERPKRARLFQIETHLISDTFMPFRRRFQKACFELSKFRNPKNQLL